MFLKCVRQFQLCALAVCVRSFELLGLGYEDNNDYKDRRQGGTEGKTLPNIFEAMFIKMDGKLCSSWNIFGIYSTWQACSFNKMASNTFQNMCIRAKYLSWPYIIKTVFWGGIYFADWNFLLAWRLFDSYNKNTFANRTLFKCRLTFENRQRWKEIVQTWQWKSVSRELTGSHQCQF